VAKRRGAHYPTAFKRMVAERMKQCDNILALSAETRNASPLMYKWCDQFDPVDKGEELPAPLNLRESRLRKEVNQLKRVLADKTLELDFFKGALQETCGNPVGMPPKSGTTTG
jgi:transposase-like protein